MWPDIDVLTAQTYSSFGSNFVSFTSNVSYTTILRLTGNVVFLYKVNICTVCSSNKAASSKLQNTCCLTKMLIQQEARSSMSHIIS